jgi:hypothetical protein
MKLMAVPSSFGWAPAVAGAFGGAGAVDAGTGGCGARADAGPAGHAAAGSC